MSGKTSENLPDNFGSILAVDLKTDCGDSAQQEHAWLQMDTTNSDLSAQISQLSAQLKLIHAQIRPQASQVTSPWLPLRVAAELLHAKSARALKARILRGGFPPDCYRQIPSASRKRHTYLVNVDRYLKTLR